MDNIRRKIKKIKENRILNELNELDFDFIYPIEEYEKIHKINSVLDGLDLDVDKSDLLFYSVTASCSGPDTGEEFDFSEYMFSLYEKSSLERINIEYKVDPDDIYDYDEEITLHICNSFMFLEVDDLEECIYIFDIGFLYNYCKNFELV